MNRILLVEDDAGIVENLTSFLKTEGFQVSSVNGQTAALELIQKETFDVMLLDISLKEGNGFTVCRAVRELGNLPIIFLTASGDEYSVVTGLELGAEDYVVKPFRPRELVSRIRNCLRRSKKAMTVYQIENLVVDTDRALVTKNGNEVYLSALEYRLLLLFLTNRGIVLSRARLLEDLWDIAGEFVNDNTLTVYIKRLREKIESDPQNPTIIRTVRGLGYKIEEA